MAEKPVVKKSVAENPVVKRPVVKNPVVKKPVVKKPVAHENQRHQAKNSLVVYLQRSDSSRHRLDGFFMATVRRTD